MIQPRDERFLEFAVASGQLDGQLAHRLYEVRRSHPATETIEQFAVSQGFLTLDAIARIVAYARDAGTHHEALVPRAAPETPSGVSATDETVKDDPVKPGTGRLGNRFGAYVIEGELGRGGMGAVYRARKEGHKETVALKVLSDEKDPTEATIRRFDREIRAGREIDHPNVVKVFDAGQVDGRLFFTMELIDGRSFEKVIDELALRQRIEIFEKIARAVQQAHSRGYIHRDLKPQNVMITPDMEPKVADFGLAKSLDRESRLTKTGTILGTIAYMSPEQAEGGGAHKLDGRTDIYSLGAILYQLICGTVPFKAPTQFGTIGLILTTDPEPPVKVDPTCPPALSAIALKALEKEPEKRFQTSAELADEIARWLHGTKVSTHAPTLGARAGRWLRRRKLPIAAFLLTSAVASATLGFLAWKRALAHRALLDETRAKLDALLAEVAQPGPTAALADRLDALEAKLATLPELAERRDAIRGLALVARSLDHEKKPEEARPLVLAALAVAPGRWDVRRACANTLERLGEPLLAARCIEAAPVKDAEAWERLGAARLVLGELPGAREALEQAARDRASEGSGGPSGTLNLLRARTLALLGDPKAVDLAKALPPSEEQALLVQEARLAAEPGAAIFGLRLVERSRKTADVRLRIAQALVRAERGFEARAAFRRARAAKASEIDCKEGEAEAELLEGRPAEAIRALDEAAKLAPRGSYQRTRLLARKARIQLLSGKEVTREALAERPDEPLARFALAGEDASLLEKLAVELGTRPEAVQAWCALARLRAKAGDKEGARAAHDKAAAIAPDDEEVLASDPSKARAAFASGRGDGARLFRAALATGRIADGWGLVDDKGRSETLLACAERAAPWAGAPSLERARRLLAQGANAVPAAREALERGLALAPDDVPGLVLLAGLVDAERAEELASRALAVEPENARALALRGKARLDRKKPAEALADLERSTDLVRQDAQAWEWQAAALEALGKPSDVARREAKDRRAALAIARAALDAKDFPRAWDLAPEAPDIIKGIIDASFRGDVSLVRDPILLYSRIISVDPADYLRGIFDREAAGSIQPNLADSCDGPEADADQLFEAFVVRCVGIVRNRDQRPDTLAKARLDLERCLSRDLGRLAAVGARAFVLALERQTELAEDDLQRIAPYMRGRVNVFVLAELLVKAQRGENVDEYLAMLQGNRSDRLTLYPWALELLKGGK